MALIDRLIAGECHGPDSGLYRVVSGLLEGEPQVTLGQAIGIARAVTWVLSEADDPDVQRFVGSSYLREMQPLVEATGRAQDQHMDRETTCGCGRIEAAHQPGDEGCRFGPPIPRGFSGA